MFERVSRVTMRLLSSTFLIVAGSCLSDMRPARAQQCTIDSAHYPYSLAAEIVRWSMKVIPGSKCLSGLRFGNVVIEDVKLVSPPQYGEVALLGSGFSYTSKTDFAGEDSFALEVFGSTNKRRGRSTIQITVSYEVGPPATIEAGPTVSPGPRAPTHLTSGDQASPSGAPLPSCPTWDWSKGSPPPMRQPIDRSKLFCPPAPFRSSNSPMGCVCPNR